MANDFGNEPTTGRQTDSNIWQWRLKNLGIKTILNWLKIFSIIVDALDESYIQLQTSDWISKKSYNQGAFAKEDTPKGTVYSLYGGRMYSSEEKASYDKLREEQIQQVKDEHSNNPDLAEDFKESTWMNM